MHPAGNRPRTSLTNPKHELSGSTRRMLNIIQSEFLGKPQLIFLHSESQLSSAAPRGESPGADLQGWTQGTDPKGWIFQRNTPSSWLFTPNSGLRNISYLLTRDLIVHSDSAPEARSFRFPTPGVWVADLWWNPLLQNPTLHPAHFARGLVVESNA